MSDTYQYGVRLTFDRIGRDRNPPTLTVTVEEGLNLSVEQQIAASAYALVMGKVEGDDGTRRRRVASNDVEASYNGDDNQGFITCGWQSGGSFTVERVPA